jgi:phosphoglycolate phosphatase-like HAD superfamily hydrolase
MKLILFDIDGTLVNVDHGVTRGAIREVLAGGLGHHDEVADVELHGKTDRQIMLELCAALGHDGDDARLEAMERILVGHWERHLGPDTVEILPGVGDLLGRLALTEGVTLGLLTGNVEAGARLKLAPHDLNRYFSFGSFGSDAVNRVDLPPIALRRAGEIAGGDFAFERTLIVGDSHRDIACARAWGIRAMAVATGALSADVLREHAPDALCDSLLESDYIFDFINGDQ